VAVNVPNPGLYVQGLGEHLTQFRNALQQLLNDAAYLNAMGGTAFLEAAYPAGIGLAAADAATVENAISIVVPSNSTVQAIQAYLASTEQLWGGQ
jgi:hypothetical protein